MFKRLRSVARRQSFWRAAIMSGWRAVRPQEGWLMERFESAPPACLLRGTAT